MIGWLPPSWGLKGAAKGHVYKSFEVNWWNGVRSTKRLKYHFSVNIFDQIIRFQSLHITLIRMEEKPI